MGRKIPEHRKGAYYLGGLLMVIGGLLFVSTFVTGAMNFGDFTDFDSRTRSEILRAISGMALLIVGGIIRGIAARGLAGSGVLLDPERAREEMEPYSRMAGGMVKDALDEANINLAQRQERTIMIKCRACGQLNEEDSNYCQACGKRL